LKLGQRKELSSAEEKFWNELIAKYLMPLENNEKKQNQTKQKLLDLRNKSCLFFFVVNTLFVTLVYTLTQVNAYKGSLRIPLPCTPRSGVSASIEPISVTFTVVFGILLLVQFICMLLHQFDTLCHIVATTEIKGRLRVKDLARDVKDCIYEGTQIYLEKRKRQQTIQVDPKDETDFNIENIYKDGRISLMHKDNLDEVDAYGGSNRLISTRYRRKQNLNLLPDGERSVKYLSFSPPKAPYETNSEDPSLKTPGTTMDTSRKMVESVAL
jgi:chitin synthase